jgi:acetyl-CoA carboxylase biotin carboxylase subunit
MGAAAVAAAKAVGYVGAGTCEFLVDPHHNFYFLEMNTRVQVEHPVTEMITNVDIVKTGIRIASGEPIGIEQEDVSINGWAVECRIYAEDPEHGFRPSPGEISVYRPPGGPGVRNDPGVYPGASVSVYYDPMVSKLICWGRNRDEAIARMKRALREFVVKGIKTSIPFHVAVMNNPVFLSGRFDTGFIDNEILSSGQGLREANAKELEVGVMLAAIAAFNRDRALAARAARPSGSSSDSAWKLAGRRGQMRGAL